MNASDANNQRYDGGDDLLVRFDWSKFLATIVWCVFLLSIFIAALATFAGVFVVAVPTLAVVILLAAIISGARWGV